MSNNSFSRKQIRTTLTLAQGNNSKFPNTNNNTLILAGLRQILTGLQVSSVTASIDLKIYGMLPQDMNALTLAFFGNADSPVIPRNTVTVETNDGNGWSQFFEGIIAQAQPEYRGAPDAYFHIQAAVSLVDQLSPATPLSYPVDTDAASIVENIAGQLGFSFENHGVTAQLKAGAYYPGTLIDQLKRVCRAVNAAFFIQGNRLFIAPVGDGLQVPVVQLAPTSGLLGYPVIEQGGIVLNCLYNPAILCGGKVQVLNTDIPAANANWCPIQILHALESENPGGAWFSEIHAIPYRIKGVNS